MKFLQVSEVFEQIEQVTARLQITRLLADLLGRASASQAAIICSLSLGQLHPPYIGTKFNIAQKSIIKVLAEFFGRPEAIIKQEAKRLGDVGAMLVDYEWSTQKELTVLQVYDSLCSIEKVSGVGSQEKKMKQLRILLADLDPLSAKYVVRIILGKIRLGFSDMTIIDALSWMEVGNKSLRSIIENAYNVCADIGFIAEKLKKEGIKALEKMHIKVGIPIRPAAAERLPTIKAIIEKIGPCVAQPKFDGFRLQIHIDKTKKKPVIHFFSRNLQDMSFMFPDLTRELLALPVEDIICEGEAIGYDPNEGTFLPFQETVKRKRKHGIEKAVKDFPLKLFIFDLLYLNGKELLNETHEQRRKKLKQLFKKFKSDQIF
ncbi:MAG TPA: ATP-dependent DNA ligase, partial [Candidatus Dependentiae bacterium]|nr:ATP-dependent DNA ligase [Candidatus Dependentiae bacterium]